MTDFPRLDDVKVLALDTETTGLEWMSNRIFGFSMSFDKEDYYWDIRETPKAIDWLRDQMKRYKGRIVNHNTKFDMHMLLRHDIDITYNDVSCTLVRAQLIDEHRLIYNLDDVAKSCIGIGKVEIYEELAGLFGGNPTREAQMGNLHKAPPEIVGPYAKRDTRTALELYRWQAGEIVAQELEHICSLEDAVLPVLTRMEHRGIRVDIAKAEENMAILGKRISEAQRNLDRTVGGHFNVNSTPQVRGLLKPVRIGDTTQFRLVDGTICSATPGSIRKFAKGEGELTPSIPGAILEEMVHPAAKMITDIRGMIKIHGTFLRDQILGYQINGRIYPNFKQCGTVNGRFSASKPALQAIPKRNPEMAALTRSVFLPEEGEEILRCDFEQSDFRGFVHYTRSPPLVKAYERDPMTDFHGLISNLLHIPRSPQPGGGVNSKQINLGSIFGMGPGKLAQQMGLPYQEVQGKRGKVYLVPGPEAEEVFKTYHTTIPGVAVFNKKSSSVARSRGHVVSIYGRHLRFPNKSMVYKAPGYLYSSFTSDLCKRAMVLTDSLAAIKLQVHDEIIFSIGNRKVVKEVKEAMESSFNGLTNIPIRTNPEVGPNWYECKPMGV